MRSGCQAKILISNLRSYALARQLLANPPLARMAKFNFCYNRAVNAKKKFLTWAALGLVLLGAGLGWMGLRQDVTVVIDGKAQTLSTRALTVGAALREAQVAVSAADRLAPSANTLLFNTQTILLERAYATHIRLEPGGRDIQLNTPERIPANLLAAAGISLYPGDRLEWNGQTLDPARPLPDQPLVLQFFQAVPVTLRTGSQVVSFYSAASTLAQALWEAGIYLRSADSLSLAGDTPLNQPMQVTLDSGRLISVLVDGGLLHTVTSAETVGAALAEAAVSLQGLDYSLPGEEQPLPADGAIRVVRVREETLLEQTPILFKSTYQPDAATEIDQRSVVTPGEYGVEVARVQVRYEDGVETSRTPGAQWIAKQPVDQVLGYGTQVLTHTLDTPEGQIEYWRAVTAYATSYSPCQSGTTRCYSGTASGLPVQKGVVAVSSAWYGWMVGQRVYIPGYGMAVIADKGGGIPGRNWVDLGYTDADYVPWSSTVTMYFLTPIPENIPWLLP